MIINELLEKNKISKYRLSKESSVPQTTINDICSGRVDVNKCEAGTLYRIAKFLGITVEDILKSVSDESRRSFEVFKSDVCHRLKDKGDLDFIIEVLETDSIRNMYNRKWYPEALYLLAMLDYLSRTNELPLCEKYNDLRCIRLKKTIYPAGIVLIGNILDSDEPYREAEKNAIPEFRRFNIIESEIRNVV